MASSLPPLSGAVISSTPVHRDVFHVGFSLSQRAAGGLILIMEWRFFLDLF
uniref:Uncharacterized protein n=1 Tax=Oryza brachyantha TaxID=4533 RepID=J3LQN0_ORYBR